MSDKIPTYTEAVHRLETIVATLHSLKTYLLSFDRFMNIDSQKY